MMDKMLTMHECVVLAVMQKLLIVWICYLLVDSQYTNTKGTHGFELIFQKCAASYTIYTQGERRTVYQERKVRQEKVAAGRRTMQELGPSKREDHQRRRTRILCDCLAVRYGILADRSLYKFAPCQLFIYSHMLTPNVIPRICID